MSTSIVLRIKSGSGSLVRVITAVRNLGLSYTGQQMEKLPDADETRLTVEVNNASLKEDQVTQTLQGLDCVIAVDGIRAAQKSGSQNTEPEILNLPALRVSETYIDRTVESYPSFMSVVERVEGSLRKASDRDDQLFAFGAAVGLRLAANNPSFPQTDNLQELQQFLKDFLSPISTFAIDGSDLTSKVSLFTRRYFNNMDMVFGSEFERCLIMTGIIHGMVNHALPGSIVSEPECRSNGDAVCRFHIKPGL
ncbi:hypothetical protein ACFL17_09955 [Pseudomonadota bacterium]